MNSGLRILLVIAAAGAGFAVAHWIAHGGNIQT